MPFCKSVKMSSEGMILVLTFPQTLFYVQKSGGQKVGGHLTPGNIFNSHKKSA